MNNYFIDTIDVEEKWGIIFERNTFNELLKFPARRDEYSQVWKDEDGTERYTDDVFFDTRTLNLSLVMVGNGESDFMEKLRGFREYLMHSGYFDFDCAVLGLRFKLLYKDMQSYTKLTQLKKTGKVAARFVLTLQDDFPAEAKSIPGVEYGGYGVEWDKDNADPLLTRIGANMNDHKIENLPVHSAIKACTLLDDGTVNYYLDPADKTKKENGDPSILDGTDGQVMLEVPAHYISFEEAGHTRRVVFSLDFMPGAVRVPKRYVGAYEAGEDDGKLTSVSGVFGVTSKSMAGFRNSARARGEGWEQYTYNVHKDWFWLYMVAYANRNCQDTYNAAPSAEGYYQGGLGAGVTGVTNTEWTDYNGRKPMVPTGVCDEIGVGCGVKDYTVEDFKPGVDQTFAVPCFLGMENIYGHIYKQLDGLLIEVFTDDKRGSTAYVFDNPKDFKDDNIKGSRRVGKVYRDSNYIVQLLFGKNGDFLPNEEKAGGGSSTTYWCDQFYQSTKPDSGSFLRAGRSGGYASNGATAGVGCVYAYNAPSYSSAFFGSRLCFLPEGR